MSHDIPGHGGADYDGPERISVSNPKRKHTTPCRTTFQDAAVLTMMVKSVNVFSLFVCSLVFRCIFVLFVFGFVCSSRTHHTVQEWDGHLGVFSNDQ